MHIKQRQCNNNNNSNNYQKMKRSVIKKEVAKQLQRTAFGFTIIYLQ